MHNNGHNPYKPIPMHIYRAYYESNDHSLKTFELVFDNHEDRDKFFSEYNPGQFCQLSIFGKGEAPFGIASAAWEGDFVRFTVQKMGSFTKHIHTLEAGEPIGMRGPLGNGFPLNEWKGNNEHNVRNRYSQFSLYDQASNCICALSVDVSFQLLWGEDYDRMLPVNKF